MALSNELRRRRGTVEEHSKFVGAEGELTVVTTKLIGYDVDSGNPIIEDVWGLAVHDGVTTGGHRVPTIAEMVTYVNEYEIEYSRLSEGLQQKIDEIDNKLSVTRDENNIVIGTEMDNLYRKISDAIQESDLSADLQDKVNASSSIIRNFISDLANIDDPSKGSTLVGFIASPTYFNNPENVTTVNQALNAVASMAKSSNESVSTVAGQMSAMNTAFNEIRDLASATHNSFVGIENEFAEYKGILGTYTSDINDLNAEIIKTKVECNEYTDQNVITINTTTSGLRTDLDELNDDVYRKEYIDQNINDLIAEDEALQESIGIINTNITNINTNFNNYYTKLQTDSNINNAVSALVNSAPETLNTLKELADALGNDMDFANTITESIATKADLESFNELNGIVVGVDETDTGLIGDVAALDERITLLDANDTENKVYGRVTALERKINGYEQVQGLERRLQVVEGIAGLDSPMVTDVESLKSRVTQLEELINRHATRLNQLADVAFSGRYDHLLGTPIIPSGYYKGKNTFNSKDGRIIDVPVNYQSTGAEYGVLISPVTNPNGTIGEVWVTKQATRFIVFCSGEARGITFDYVIFKNND